MASASLEVSASGGSAGQATLEDENEVSNLNVENILERFGSHQVTSILNGEILDSHSTGVIIDITKLLASVYDNLKSGLNEELEEYTDRVARISSRYRNDPELKNHLSKWRETRKKLIELAKSSADKLDNTFATVNLGRMFGSAVEILNSLNLNIYQQFCSSIASYVYSISPKLGFVTETALELAPHLRFMGFAISFFDIFYSQILINRVVEAMKEDKDMLEPIKKWFDETKEFEESVRNLFPHGINKGIIESIDKALVELGEEEKIFSAAILSNVIKDPAFSKDARFLTKVFLFCRSDASKEWYNRMLTGDRPSDLERSMFYFRTELQQLEGSDIDSGSKLEIAKCTTDQLENSAKSTVRSILGRFIVCGMSGMSVYYCYENLRSGSKHRYSSRLRELSRNASSFLNEMKRVRFDCIR